MPEVKVILKCDCGALELCVGKENLYTAKDTQVCKGRTVLRLFADYSRLTSTNAAQSRVKIIPGVHQGTKPQTSEQKVKVKVNNVVML